MLVAVPRVVLLAVLHTFEALMISLAKHSAMVLTLRKAASRA